MFEIRKVGVNIPYYLDLSASCLILSVLHIRILASGEKVGNEAFALSRPFLTFQNWETRNLLL